MYPRPRNNQFSRCTQNVILGTHTLHGAIFVEASYQPNLVDQNILWQTAGHGIYEHDSTGQIFAHNLIAHSTRCGLHLHGRITDRRVDGRPMVYGRHTVRNNVLIGNAQPDQFLGDPSDVAENVRDGATATLDATALTLTWSLPPAGTKCSLVPGVTHDLLGRPRAAPATCAGPFGAPAGTRQKLASSPAAVP